MKYRDTCLMLLLTLTATALLSVAAPDVRAEPIVVVVGRDSPVQRLTLGDLQRIFLRLPMQTEHNLPFVPFNYPAKSDVRERFDSIVLGMSPEDVGRHWIDQRIRGQQSPPNTIPSPALLCRVVARLPGAIAYMPASLVGTQCKAVPIDGVAPGQAGYVLASDPGTPHTSRALCARHDKTPSVPSTVDSEAWAGDGTELLFEPSLFEAERHARERYVAADPAVAAVLATEATALHQTLLQQHRLAIVSLEP